MGSYRYRSLLEGLYKPYRSLIGALYTLNFPPVVSFKPYPLHGSGMSRSSLDATEVPNSTLELLLSAGALKGNSASLFLKIH